VTIRVEAFIPDPDSPEEYVPVILVMDEDAYLEAVVEGRKACEGPQDGDHVH